MTVGVGSEVINVRAEGGRRGELVIVQSNCLVIKELKY